MADRVRVRGLRTAAAAAALVLASLGVMARGPAGAGGASDPRTSDPNGAPSAASVVAVSDGAGSGLSSPLALLAAPPLVADDETDAIDEVALLTEVVFGEFR